MNEERIFIFLNDVKLVYPGPYKQGMKMKRLVQPTQESEEITQLMPEERGEKVGSNDIKSSCPSKSKIEDVKDPGWNDF